MKKTKKSARDDSFKIAQDVIGRLQRYDPFETAQGANRNGRRTVSYAEFK